MSQSKNRIFIGNIPRKWEESDLKNAVTQVGPGVLRVDLMKVQFYSNAPMKETLPLSLEHIKLSVLSLCLLHFSKIT